MKKAIVTYTNGKKENFNSWDFTGIITKNDHKEQITKIELRGDNGHGKECPKFQAFFQETPEGVCELKPWPVLCISKDFNYFELGTPEDQYVETEEILTILSEFDLALCKEKVLLN